MGVDAKANEIFCQRIIQLQWSSGKELFVVRKYSRICDTPELKNKRLRGVVSYWSEKF